MPCYNRNLKSSFRRRDVGLWFEDAWSWYPQACTWVIGRWPIILHIGALRGGAEKSPVSNLKLKLSSTPVQPSPDFHERSTT